MKKYIIALFGVLMLNSSCQDILEVEPKGVLNESQLKTVENAEGFVIAAYSALGYEWYDKPMSSGLTAMSGPMMPIKEAGILATFNLFISWKH